MPFPYVFTFYSYKGGVGRSMALLNVGYTLASHGRHVLMVDMDLEAPGISSFLHRNHELAPPVGTPLDILPLLFEAIRLGREADPTDTTVEQLAPVAGYIHSVARERLEALKPKMGSLGRLDLLGADLNRDFNSRLAMLPLKTLRHEELIRVSRLLHRYFKAQRFPHRPLGVEDFEAPISTPYDYVLVDSRTGITEIGGLCIGPMADRLVVVTGLNDQNVNGTLEFLKEAGIETRARVTDGEPWDSADPVSLPEHPSLGPKPTIVVASPVPTGEILYKRKRLEELEKLLGVKPVSLSYHPQMALMESIFVRDYQEEYLTGDYGRLVRRVVSQVGDSAEQLAAEATRLATEGKNVEGAVELALRLAPQVPQIAETLLSQFDTALQSDRPIRLRLFAHMAQAPSQRPFAFSNWGNALSDQAKQKSGAEADGLSEQAWAKYAEAVRLKPDYASAFYNWGIALSEQAKHKSGAEADGLFEQASAKYAEAVRFKSDFAEAFSNWGNALSEQAKQKSGAEADGLFERASAKHAEAVRLKPDLAAALANWGNALASLAKQKSGAEADGLFEQASAKYAEAVRLKPDSAKAFSNWGNALSLQAKRKSGAEADGLFERASAKYAEAVRLKPDSAKSFSNWGNALSDQAQRKSGAEADGLFAQASAKYAEAVRLKPDLAEAFSNWGHALSEQAKQKGGAEAAGLFEQASTKCAEAVRLKPDFADALYNWGNALVSQAQQKSGAEGYGLFERASAKYAEAVRLKPDFADALSNWGASLSEQAKQNSGPAADVLFEQALAKYAEASRLQPDNAEKLCGWGAALSDHANQKPGAEGDEFFERAFAKYAESVCLKPDFTLAFSNWGAALSYQAKRKTGAESNELYALARQKLAAAGTEGLYNLACLEALLGNTDATIKHLKAALANGNRLSCTQLIAEKDFDSVRAHPEFQKLLATLPEA